MLIKRLKILTLAAILLFSQLALAKPDGYVSFDDLTKDYGEPKVEINLNTTLMGFISNMSKHGDPEVAQLLSKLENIKVLVYNTKGNSSSALKTVEKLTKKMRKDNWHPIVSVNEDNERVRIFAKYNKDIMDGLVVMVVKGGFNKSDTKSEVVFINIVGEIDPKNLSKVTRSLNIKTMNN